MMSSNDIASLQREVAELWNKLNQSQFVKDEQFRELTKNIDVFFLVTMGIIVYFMQCGFAFLECGAVRSKNTTNILIKNVLDSFVACLAYWLIGFPLAFGSIEGDNNPFIGTLFWAHSSDFHANAASHGNIYAFWFFQMTFAATCATIVSGSMAERCDFPAYMSYSFFLTAFLFPVVTHWVWDEHGWLAAGFETDGHQITYLDFAGSSAVHLCGGIAALVGAVFLGPRVGRFDEYGTPVTIRGHSVPLSALGGFILFFGFFAFNGGSKLGISETGSGTVVATACINTIISGSAAAFTCLVASYAYVYFYSAEHHWSLLTTINGALCGMVSICAGCDDVYTWGAFVIGVVAGLSFLFWSWAILKMKIDDPLDAFAVHGGSGLWGVLAAPLFKKDVGVLFMWDRIAFLQWGWNIAGTAAIVVWSAVLAVMLFGLLKVLGLLRVDQDLEVKGLDIPKHGEPAYPVDSYGHGWGERGDTLVELARVTAKQSTITLGAQRAGEFGHNIDAAADLLLARRYENAERHAHRRNKLLSAEEHLHDMYSPTSDKKPVMVNNERGYSHYQNKAYIQNEASKV